MLISLNWLDELLTGPQDPRLDPQAVELGLTRLGLEVEGVTHYGSLPGVVVGEIKSVEKHPEADKLNVVSLFDGQETLTVVCGASNLPEPGGKVAFARVGASLPGGFEIGRRKLRGIESSGMICSEVELDIGPDDAGIMILPRNWSAGTALSEALVGIEDTVIEISVTPNRPDALGHWGVARDLGALLGRRLQTPVTLDPEAIEAAPEDKQLVTVVSAARERCPRYLGFALEGAKVGDSPAWLRLRLHRVGLRPISNVVDITNLCLMEFGQPMHAFDRGHLGEGRVVVRPATAGESMTTLDASEIEMGEDDLVIADAQAPQALAGVMGGERSMVEPGCDRILLEVAWFAPGPVRRSARRHGFHTDSSHRFERGVDWGEGLELAAARALWLLQDLCEAKLSARCEVRDDATMPTRPAIMLRPPKIGGLLGMEIPDEEARAILERLGLEIEATEHLGEHAWRCLAPSHRPDLGLEVDLIEEVMRFWGLEHLPATPVPRRDSLEAGKPGSPTLRITQALAEAGMHQLVSIGFEDPVASERMGAVAAGSAVVVDNPLRQQHAHLRTHMLVNLMEAAKLNMSRHARPLRLFEVGRVYDWAQAPAWSGHTRENDAQLPRERTRAGFLWADENSEVMAAVASGLSVLERMGLEGRALNGSPEGAQRCWHPGVVARLCSPDGEQVYGAVGEVHPDLVEAWDLPRAWTLVYAEFWLESFERASSRGHEGLPRFPASSRDLSLDLDLAVPVSTIVDLALACATAADAGAVRLAAGDSSRDAIEVVADYRGKGVEAGRRSLSLRFHYRADEGTPTEDDLRGRHEEIVQAILSGVLELDARAQIR